VPSLTFGVLYCFFVIAQLLIISTERIWDWKKTRPMTDHVQRRVAGLPIFTAFGGPAYLWDTLQKMALDDTRLSRLSSRAGFRNLGLSFSISLNVDQPLSSFRA